MHDGCDCGLPTNQPAMETPRTSTGNRYRCCPELVEEAPRLFGGLPFGIATVRRTRVVGLCFEGRRRADACSSPGESEAVFCSARRFSRNHHTRCSANSAARRGEQYSNSFISCKLVTTNETANRACGPKIVAGGRCVGMVKTLNPRLAEPVRRARPHRLRLLQPCTR